ncbi:MAG: Ni/Fe hydrogenase subunit alpha [Actinobacteria bacterium]|nr:Ni/Fe hydrogenase subunit alpha [Actinomycetota bacterium]
MSVVDINVEHIARVEGHGNIVINIKEGKIEELRLEIVESPRFFEAMVLGRRFDEAPHITSRICGICSVGHTLTSLKAVEAAMDIKPSKQTIKLRRLLTYGATMQSHILHEYFLAAPDFLGVGSVVPLVSINPDVVKRALYLKKLANDMCDLIGGRTVHPTSTVVNGFTKIPKVEELKELKEKLIGSFPDLEATVKLYKTLRVPAFNRETEYLALKSNEEYAFYEGDQIASSDDGLTPVENYKDKVCEKIVSYSSAKHCNSIRESLMVGALSRININYDQLTPMAKKAAADLNLNIPCFNPYMNNIAQIVETLHCVEASISLIDELLKNGLKEEDMSFKIKSGRGVGACEVPRGTLYHEYEIDNNGIITKANLIIPTGQNLKNMEMDLEALIPNILDKTKEEITLAVEMLIRAYDPCISCSTHLINVVLKY